jgi:hypothetical protein
VLTTEESSKTEGQGKLWDYPWKYAESFIIAIEIMVAGFIIEVASGGKGIAIPGLPYNIFIIFVFAAILLFLHLRYWESPVITWISSIPAAISSISVYAFLILLLGFIPQNSQETSKFLGYTGLSHIKSSWPFLLIQFYFLTSLGMVTLRRAIPFKKKNFGFLLNHFGLWLTLLSAGLGSADLKMLTFNLYEDGKVNNIAESQQGEMFKMPFALELLKFDVEQYSPKIAIVNIKTNKYNMGKLKSLPFVEKNLETEIAGWQIKVLDYIPSALLIEGKVQIYDSAGSSPAAYIFAKNKLFGDTVKGWITSGSFAMNPAYLNLKEIELLTLTQPEPKKFCSKLVVFKDEQNKDTVTLEVNKPYSVKGWDIYQVGYDESKGKWSTQSVIQAVKDPWLPIVYVGVFLLISGAVYMFWIGKDKKEKIY